MKQPTGPLSFDKFSRAIDDVLEPDMQGVVRFGKKREPFRSSQIDALKAVQQGERRAHIVQPGGTGKTREGIALAYAMHLDDRKSLYVVPDQITLNDFAHKTKELLPGLDVGKVYSYEKRLGNLTFITYASLMRRILGDVEEAHAETPDPEEQNLRIDPHDYDLVIWDECHMYLTPNAQTLLSRFNDAVNIGFTATPRYYEGKEVANVFGPCIYNLDIDTAMARGEINPFQNILINTGIVTGLKLSSPDQEESKKVAKALNRQSRHLIVPDLYTNLTVDTPHGKKPIFGEPAFVLSAGIDNVHAQAEAMNCMLMPRLKTDEDLRKLLRSKGIDPDQVQQIAAPLHSGSTETHKHMTLSEREHILDLYHQRKILTLVGTSVLQQGVDSPQTSVIFDTVPRKTYVGAGQAAMRALRPVRGKQPSLIVNMEDADHRSLTFTDVIAMRGHEEGAIFPDLARGTTPQPKLMPTQDSNVMASYNVISGSVLSEFLEHRGNPVRVKEPEKPSSAESEKQRLRHFEPEEYATLNRLIGEIAKGNDKAADEFKERIAPFMHNVFQRIVTKKLSDPEDARGLDVHYRALDTCMKYIRNGTIDGWGKFHTHYLIRFNHNLLTVNKMQAENTADLVPLNAQVLVEEESDTDNLERNELRNLLNRAASRLKPKQRRILDEYFGEERILDEIAAGMGVTRERIRQIREVALGELRRSSPLRRYIDFTTLYEIEPPDPSSFSASTRVISEIRSWFRSALGDKKGNINYAELVKQTGQDEAFFRALTNPQQARFEDSFEILDKEAMNSLAEGIAQASGISSKECLAKLKQLGEAVSLYKDLLQLFRAENEGQKDAVSLVDRIQTCQRQLSALFMDKNNSFERLEYQTKLSVEQLKTLLCDDNLNFAALAKLFTHNVQEDITRRFEIIAPYEKRDEVRKIIKELHTVVMQWLGLRQGAQDRFR